MRRPLRGLALACVAAAACGRPAAEVTRPPADTTSTARVPAEVRRRYERVPLEVYAREGALVAGFDREATVARLGPPDSSRSVATTNRHDPQITDSIVTLHYDGGRYVFYVVTQASRDLLELAMITSDEHLRHATPGIGTSADSVRALLGPPVATRPGTLEYDCLTCEVPLPVTFEIENGRVRAIRFDYYVD